MDSAWAIAGGTAVFLGSLLPFISFSNPISIRACGHGEHHLFTLNPRFARGAGMIIPALGTENR
jgi:hypothetical protein